MAVDRLGYNGFNFSSREDVNSTVSPELQALIAQLMGQGTEEQQYSRNDRRKEISNVRNQRADYTKGAAFADAQGAVDAQLRAGLKELLPSINNAALGAGTSQSSMRALLLQDAAQKAADSAATLGLKASVDYGNIGANLSGVLEALTRQQDPQTLALLEALKLQASGLSRQSSGGSLNNGGFTVRNGSSSRRGDLIDPIDRRTNDTMGYVAPRVELSNEMASNIKEVINANNQGGTIDNSGWKSFVF
jgi:hypothetical protein